ncbi:helix-turn-helix domain-containing protein [Desulfurivibrio sp. D14AmB]|uniref:helix-turn-helix domain-containing protein n=1 Tax=Desulfurivibrio sp. D14AmB TaxID=3374370 RepID=UPI00376F3602
MRDNVSSEKNTSQIRRSQGKRLLEFREHIGVSQKEFAEKLGIPTYKPISNMERGITEIKPELAKLIQYEFGCSQDWLMTGKGSMVFESTRSMSDREPRPSSRRTVSYADKLVDSVAGERRELAVAESREGYAMLDRIYSSGDQMMVQAINVSLSALNEALGYKELAKQVLDAQHHIQQDIRRLQADISKLKAENELLRMQLGGKNKDVVGG